MQSPTSPVPRARNAATGNSGPSTSVRSRETARSPTETWSEPSLAQASIADERFIIRSGGAARGREPAGARLSVRREDPLEGHADRSCGNWRDGDRVDAVEPGGTRRLSRGLTQNLPAPI